MAEMTEIERLVEIRQIEELQARRCYAVDNHDFALFEALHAPEHISYHEFGTWNGIKEAVAAVTAGLAGKTSMHHLHTPIITMQSPTTASGIWAMEDHLWWEEAGQEHRSQGWGFYYETYEKRDGRWLFTSRRLTRKRVETSTRAKP